jgi:DNA-directed RNA polymerase II subunit RPB1
MTTTRYLHPTEISEILDHVFDQCKPNSVLTPDLDRKSILRNSIAEELQSLQMYPEILPQLKKYLRQKILTSFISPGSSVGVVCAQSIGEKQTQMTLNTFHAAGITVETVVTGVPRFMELLNASKEPKLSSTRLYIPTDRFPSTNHLRKYLYQHVLEIRFSAFCDDFEFCNSPSSLPVWYDLYMKLFLNRPQRSLVRRSKSFIRITLNHDNLFRFQLFSMDIAMRLQERLYEEMGLVCLASPISIGEIHIFSDSKLTGTQHHHEDENDEDEDEQPITTVIENMTHHSSSTSIQEISLIHTILNTLLFGIPGIHDFFIEKTPEANIVHTKGNNYTALMGLDCIDTSHTISNNMWNIWSVLGIEATRQFLIDEFSSIISSDGAFINNCHIHLLVDIMTFSGNIVSVSRYGMKNDQFGALAKASFEESLDNFLKASIFAETERTTDVSASIICGKRSNIGSGLCDMMLDTARMF